MRRESRRLRLCVCVCACVTAWGPGDGGLMVTATGFSQLIYNVFMQRSDDTCGLLAGHHCLCVRLRNNLNNSQLKYKQH